MAPSQVKFNAAYRNKLHVLKISISGVSAESSRPKLCQKFTIQGRLLHVSIPTALEQHAHYHFKCHMAHINIINCNNYYSTTGKGILQQNQDCATRITCRSPCQCNNFIFLCLLFFPKIHWRQVQIYLFTFTGKREAEALINLITEETGAHKNSGSAPKSTHPCPGRPSGSLASSSWSGSPSHWPPRAGVRA